MGVTIERGDSIGTTNCMVITDYKNSETTIYFGADLDVSRGGRVRFAQGIGGVSPYQQWLDEGNEGSFADFMGLWHSHANKSTLDKISDPLSGILEKFGLDKNGQLVYDGQLVNLGGASEPVNPDPNGKMYYGYVNDGKTWHITDITAPMLTAETMTETNAAAVNKAVISAPAGSLTVVLIPADAKLTAKKDDGFGGMAGFDEDNGETGTGGNGVSLTLDGKEYRAYGEFNLIDGETFIYIMEA